MNFSVQARDFFPAYAASNHFSSFQKILRHRPQSIADVLISTPGILSKMVTNSKSASGAMC